MHLDKAAYKCEPNTNAALLTPHGAVRLSEKIENLREHFGRDAHPVIADADAGLVAIALHRDFDATLSRSVFGCVVEEIGEHLSETHRIAVNDDRLVAQREANLLSPRLYQRLIRFPAD